ncbi:MAG: cytochrome c family protein [Phycisphaerae bacterium]|nr:cytochrome c family protein [Phycisphaerae bacterium]
MAAPPRQDKDELVVFLTGSELGSLRPCGCSGGQLGGIEKRSAVFDSVPASRRLVVETGSLAPSDREQDLMKFRILFEAYNRLNYDVVHLTGRDHEIAARLGVLEDPHTFDIIDDASDRPAVSVKRLVTRGRDATIRVASSRSRTPEAVDASTVDIVILERGDPDSLKAVKEQWPGVQCIVCPSSSDEPQLLSKPGDVPLVCTVGRFGRYICRINVTLEERTSRPILHFESVAVQAKLPDDPALVQLYRQYQQLVAQSSLLESYPRVPLADKLAFAGSGSCKQCHEPAYDKWAATAHAHAFASLKRVGSDRDPECVICHVIGLGSEGGFVNEEKTPLLAGVGCENCHGPGSGHVLSAGQTAPGQPRTACTQCHTPEQSGGFAGHEEEFMKKIMHGREPATVGNVKH